MDFSKSSRICCTGFACDKQHFMKRFQDFIKTCFVVDTSDFVSIWQHHRKMVYVKCAWGACPQKKPCRLHKELEKFTQFVDFVRDRNSNHNNEVISKIAFVFEKDSCRNELFWWYRVREWDYKGIPEGKDIRWRAQYR